MLLWQSTWPSHTATPEKITSSSSTVPSTATHNCRLSAMPTPRYIDIV